MRRYTIGLAGFVLAAAMAAPVMAANMAPASSAGGADSLLPPAGEPGGDRTVIQSSDVEGTQVINCDCRNWRLPTANSPLETALEG